ncbi:MAG: hypothetical protein ACRD3L_01440 [Terriglobales bacterium]
MPKVLEIPPSIELLKSVEEHAHGEFKIQIQFYETPEGKHFVWPYIRLVRGDSDSMKHFMVQGHFSTKDEARAAALSQGRKLADSGFDVHRID